jgi:hypothetical protein
MALVLCQWPTSATTGTSDHKLTSCIPTRIQLYIVDIHLPVITKLKRAFAFLLSKGICCFIDFGVLGELPIRFYLSRVSVYVGFNQEI